MRHVQNPRDCDGDELAAALNSHPRVLVYLGFRDIPEGFDDLILHRLSELGTASVYREFTDVSRAAIIDSWHSRYQRPYAQVAVANDA